MKVAIVHDFLIRHGGAENVVLELVRIYPHADVYTLLYDEESMKKTPIPARIHTSFLQKFLPFVPSYRWLFPFMRYAIESFDLSEYDLIISSSGAFSYGVLTHPQQIHIAYVHAPLRWVHDTFYDFIRKTPRLLRIMYQSLASSLRSWSYIASRRPNSILVPSNEVQQRVKHYWRLESSVVAPPVELQQQTDCPREGRYFVIVSQLVEYKRIDLAIAYCNAHNIPLVIVGKGVEEQRLQQQANKHIVFKGAVYGKEKFDIIKNARGFFFCGYDDFGIAPVEALSLGIPVIAYKKGGVMDYIQEGINGVFFEEQTLESLSDAMETFFQTSFDAQTIQASAQAFSPEAFRTSIQHFVSLYTQETL